MSIKLEDASIATLLEGLERGDFSSVDLTETYIRRIDDLNKHVHAISQLNPDALSIARTRDDERAAGTAKGLLHGIPIAVKDVFLTKDRLRSTTTVIQRLRHQGAVLLAKTNLSQWCNYRNMGAMPASWSAVGGICRGPWAENQDPVGSSNGSAVAARLALGAAALGTETEGSISSPAHKSAVVGIKPTVGMVSRHGSYCSSKWNDSIGVLAKTVADAAVVLSAIAGPDPEDSFTIADPRDGDGNGAPKPEIDTDFFRACIAGGLGGKRIGVPRNLDELSTTVLETFEKALDVMKSLGAEIVNVQFSEYFTSALQGSDEFLTIAVNYVENMKSSLANYETNPCGLHTLDDVMKYTENTPEERHADFGMGSWTSFRDLARKHALDSPELLAAQESCKKLGAQVDELLVRTGCHMIVTPARSSASRAAYTGGLPCVTVPIGFMPLDEKEVRRSYNDQLFDGPGIPMAAVFMGRRWADFDLISAAFAYEQEANVLENTKPYWSSDIKLPSKRGQDVEM